jgi:peptidoglycan/xylan/chitin deacetylase (PgdA/CDA1 family)
LPATSTPFLPQTLAASTAVATEIVPAAEPVTDRVTATLPVPEGLFLEPACPTPRSLMLHSAFGPQRMQDLAQEIERRGWRTATYRSLLDTLRAGECPGDDLIIVSVDDVGTSWIRPTFKDMVQVFVEHDMVLVIAVVVRPPQDPAIWEYLKGLDALGIEVASHTVNHYSLPQLREEVREEEISGSYDIICEELGRCPVTLVLPFGNGGEDESVLLAASQYPFVVGIRGGRSFSAGPPYHLGRIPPNNDNQAVTLDLLDGWVER